LLEHGIEVLRIADNEMIGNEDGTIQKIFEKVQERMKDKNNKTPS
jgi:very-short-patch-repair endonuclease